MTAKAKNKCFFKALIVRNWKLYFVLY